MARSGIEQAYAAMYEHSDRYPGCSMFSALPDAPVVEARRGVLARLPRMLARAASAAARLVRVVLAPRPRAATGSARGRGARESARTTS